MTSWPVDPGWRPQLDNPDFAGWSVVAAYVIAAACCARAALARRRMGPEERRFSVIWWLMAIGLLCLGINKQLNLQTLLIVLGRHAALAGGWFSERRLVQMVFSLVFTLAGAVALWVLLARLRRFFALNLWAAIGVLVLGTFVLIRAASINHVFERIGVKQDDKKWTWVLEIGSSACLALAAAKAGRPAGNGQP